MVEKAPGFFGCVSRCAVCLSNIMESSLPFRPETVLIIERTVQLKLQGTQL